MYTIEDLNMKMSIDSIIKKMMFHGTLNLHQNIILFYLFYRWFEMYFSTIKASGLISKVKKRRMEKTEKIFKI